MTRQEYLTNVLAKLNPRYQIDNLSIEYIPFHGWYLCGEPRHFGNDGRDFLGNDWDEAEQQLNWLITPIMTEFHRAMSKQV
jgi:hypothetical protein